MWLPLGLGGHAGPPLHEYVARTTYTTTTSFHDIFAAAFFTTTIDKVLNIYY